MLFGVVCIVGDVTATFATVLAFGWLLLLSGVVALIHAFRARTWSGFLLSLLSAQMPASSVWFIGFAIGVDMIVDGTSLVGFATAIHSLPGLPVYRAA
jgi:uncharacterized membrane protein HdeD (DUF308 family)